MDFKLLDKVFKEIKPELEALMLEYEGGLCVIATRLAYVKLRELGFHDLRVAGGKAMFSVNAGANGLVDYGYARNSLIGRYIGHYWLVYKDKWIIDFTLPFLKAYFVKDNKKRGIIDNRFKLSKNVFVPLELNYTYSELFAGKIGHHYLELEGRGDTVWLNDMPEIV